jgi:hypothetical protein
MPTTEINRIASSGPRSFGCEYLKKLSQHDAEIESHFYAHFRPRLYIKLMGYWLAEWEKHLVIEETLSRVLEDLRTEQLPASTAFGAHVSAVCGCVLSRFLGSLDVSHKMLGFHDRSGALIAPSQECVRQMEAILNDLSVHDRNLLRAAIIDHLDPEEVRLRFGASSRDRLRLLLRRACEKMARVGCREDNIAS